MEVVVVVSGVSGGVADVDMLVHKFYDVFN